MVARRRRGVGLHALNRPPMLIVIAGDWRCSWPVRRPLRVSERLVRPAVFLLAAFLVYRPSHYPQLPRDRPRGADFIARRPQLPHRQRAGGRRPGSSRRWASRRACARTGSTRFRLSKTVYNGRDVAAPEVSGLLLAPRPRPDSRASGGAEAKPARAQGAVHALRGLPARQLQLSVLCPRFRGPLTWLIVGPALVVPLGLVGLFVARPRGRDGYWMWAGGTPLAMLSVVVFYVAARYRIPYQMGAVRACGRARRLGHRRRARAVGTSLGPVGGRARWPPPLVIVLWPTRLFDGRSEEQVRMGSARDSGGPLRRGRGVDRSGATANHHTIPDIVHMRAGQIVRVCAISPARR